MPPVHGSRQVQHGVEARDGAGPVHHPEKELRAEKAVASIGGFVRKIELRRQHRAVRGLVSDVEVPCAPGIKPWHDCLKAVAALVIRELVATEAVCINIVGPRIIRVPEINESVGDRSAGARAHGPRG